MANKGEVMYIVVYCCATLPDQILTDPLSFEEATQISCEMTAELLLEVSNANPEEESFIVQPAL